MVRPQTAPNVASVAWAAGLEKVEPPENVDLLNLAGELQRVGWTGFEVQSDPQSWACEPEVRTEVERLAAVNEQRVGWKAGGLTQLLDVVKQLVPEQRARHRPGLVADAEGSQRGEQHHPDYRRVSRVVARKRWEPCFGFQLEVAAQPRPA